MKSSYLSAAFLVALFVGLGFLFHGSAADAANEIVAPCVWEVTCTGVGASDGGVSFLPTTSQCPSIPRATFSVSNVKEDGTNNTATVYLGTKGRLTNTTTRSRPLLPGAEKSIDGDPSLWACSIPADAGSETIELMGASR